MVVLHVKSSTSSCSSFSPSPSPSDEEEMEFLYECAATTAVADVAAALAGTAGLQARLLSLCRRLRGRSPSGELERALSEAEAYASKVQVRHNKFLSPRALREHIKNIEKTAACVLQETSEALCTQQPKSDEKLDSIQLWWAGKELAMDKKLSDYIGVNDKTKCLSECNRRSLESGNVTHGKPALFSNRPKIWCGKMAPLCRQVQVHHNKFLSSRALREHIKNIEKTAANALQETKEAFFLQHPKSDEKCDRIQLWWVGKELAMDKKLSDYIGVNDKTKIVVRLSLPMSL